MIELIPMIKVADISLLTKSIHSAKKSQNDLKKKMQRRKFLNYSYMLAFNSSIPKDIISMNII